MARKHAVVSVVIAELYREVRAVLEQARVSAYRLVNVAMVRAYWHVGRLIVEHEQGGRERAAYGEAVLEALSDRLTTEFGRGFDVTNLRKMRQFHRMFEIRDAARLDSGVEKIRHTACGELSWSHFRLLMQVENPTARQWFMREAADQHWSMRQLDRQISFSTTSASWQAEPRRRCAARRRLPRHELGQQRSLTLQGVARMASALVLPHPARGTPEVRRLRPAFETEGIAMQFVLDHERSLGRQVDDVHQKNLGYDVTSLDLGSGELHLIEVTR